MSDKPSRTRVFQILSRQLHHPVRLRLILCTAILTTWYFGFFSSLSAQISGTIAQIDKERNRSATAREIEGLRKALAPYRDRVPATPDLNELIRHVMDHIRPTSFKLIDLRPEKPRDLGPFEAIALHLAFEGRFADLSAFLDWVRSDQRLMRVDTLSVSPNPRDPTKLVVQMSLLGLVEKEKSSARARPGRR
jgi:hypothetical protein